jgi:hypothetical protein
MLNRLIQRRIEAFERAFKYDASYMKEVLAVSRAAFALLARLQAMAAYRKDVPPAAWYAAKLVATMHEDCGPCTQLVADMASNDGVAAATVRAILTGREDAMDADTLLGYRFARGVLARASQADDLRGEIVRRFGARGLISLAFGIAGSRMYPTLKYALGHGRACRAVVVAGQTEAITVGVAA